MSRFVVVIPARYASTRLPGKPLRLIADEPMIQHVHRVATRSAADEVWIATDDARIENAATGFGANVCMTSADHTSGTERLAEVCDLQNWPDDLVVVNLQGDEPLMPPSLIDQCAGLLDSTSADMATLASELFSPADYEDPNVAKVIVNAEDNALYFSRAPIPFSRDEDSLHVAHGAALRHHGMYAYRRHVLATLVAAEPCVMEECEKLEQLRALWLGITLKVGRAKVRPGPGVDTEEDLEKVNAALS
jgi:3-deoxy-manno-octulosonate cytidylyltransferase (CMP-KDO synthetase)